MAIDGSVIMWAFGLVFVSFSSLFAVIWAMLNRRITTIETQMMLNRKEISMSIDNIYNEIKESRQQMLTDSNDIRHALTEVYKAIHEANSHQVKCAEKFATKEEVARGKNG